MKKIPSKADITAKVTSILAALSQEDARILAAFMPETLLAFVDGIGEHVPRAEDGAECSKLTCPVCGETNHERFTIFYDDMATRSVQYRAVTDLNGGVRRIVQALDSTYEHTDGFTTNYLFLNCTKCGRDTALPKGLEIEFW